ncbi:hypothetical protein K504DRAFT_476371 [Pleomassaria siparia CBS 279.74]|uniref:Uncharacterized protein n=1 Tax=Pleomassaria siparia CBS 279.74 TaxID=1314801 RepID=A0A6G1KCY6_9PLEO|nr:hypothetical protein K504DRAFT_476371 [Pleomassaria siparia CBS 279.74]
MATYTPYNQYHDQQQVLLPSNMFDYNQQYYPQSPKTPTSSSLINHPGLSPGPLSTPPRSRNPSQPPDQLSEQAFEPMAWDDGSGSLSNSPTSVRTPDNETFDCDMLDESHSMRDFYQNQSRNPAMYNTTHVVQQAHPAMGTTMLFTDQGIQDALQASVASHNHQQQQLQFQYRPDFVTQSQPPQDLIPPQPYNQDYGQTYTQQPTRHDPWNGQGPRRNPNQPNSGIPVFDPVSDPIDYLGFDYPDVANSDDIVIDFWRTNNTDPNYLASPNDHMPHIYGSSFPASPHTAQVYPQPQDHPHQHPPVRLQWTPSSPAPDPEKFINYNSSSIIFTDSYNTDSPFSPSSPGASSMGHAALPPYQPTISPQASAPSPGGSDDVFSSYQHSDIDTIDSYLPEHSEPQPPPSPVHVQRASRTVLFASLHPPPEPESRRAQSVNNRDAGNRPGGRQLGTHLPPQVAKAAHDMRRITACWHCVLQRDKCGPGDICERCLKRSQRPNADCGLGCSRIKLVELASYFLPTLATEMHEDSHLTHFVSQYIHEWQNREITVHMTCGQKSMPRFPVKVYEFIPKGNELLVQIQYRTDPKTHQRYPVKKRSPALGMKYINRNEEKKYDKYITDIVDSHLDAFGDLCWADVDNDFQERLFRLITRVKPKSEDEEKLFHEVFRLIVCTFIMSHTLTMAEEYKDRTLSKMHSYTGHDSYADRLTSPRMTNRQLKYFFSRLQRSIMSTILNKLQQIFKSSKGCDKWLAAFVVVVGMCMAHEDQQQTIHQVQATKAATDNLNMREMQARADIACRDIDARMAFITHIFRLKYNRKVNPLKEASHDWEREVGFGDASSVDFVRQVAQLVKDNTGFLQARQNVSISYANQNEYPSRLVAKFLLSFWLP